MSIEDKINDLVRELRETGAEYVLWINHDGDPETHASNNMAAAAKDFHARHLSTHLGTLIADESELHSPWQRCEACGCPSTIGCADDCPLK